MGDRAFDEAGYLAANPDVAAAVAAGGFPSGLAHYEQYGHLEGRGWGGPRTREEKALCAIDAAGLGLEIGPSHSPIAPKRAGYRVHVLDHLDTAGLRAKYAGHGVDLDRIEEVDFVWSGQPLVELIGRSACYDWILASHVIEHVPDFVQFLQQCEALLEPEGRLSLIVPDKRYCFDHFCPVTTTGQFLDAHRERRTRPSPGQVFDHLAGASKRDGGIAWSAGASGPMSLVHGFEQAKRTWQHASDTDDYLDVHCWRFTPESFELALWDLGMLGLVGLVPVESFGTAGCEFYVTLGKGRRSATPDDRLALLGRLPGL